MSYKDIFITLFNNITSDIHEDFFVERLIVTQVDLTPTELSALYKYIDLDEDNSININQLLAVLNLDELRGVYIVYTYNVYCRYNVYSIENMTTLVYYRVMVISVVCTEYTYAINCIYRVPMYTYI